MIVHSEFGSLLRAMREKRLISQSTLADRAEFNHSYLSRLEAGTRMPTRDAVDRIADGMKLSTPERNALLGSAGYIPRGMSLEINIPGLLDLDRAYVLVSEEVQREIRNSIRLLYNYLKLAE